MLLDLFGLWYSTLTKSGVSGSKGRKRVWIEDEGRILVFRNATDAAAYLQQKEQPKVKRKKVKPVEVVPVASLTKYQVRLREELPEFVSVAEAKQDIGLLLTIIRKVKAWQDEDDLETLLLAI